VPLHRGAFLRVLYSFVFVLPENDISVQMHVGVSNIYVWFVCYCTHLLVNKTHCNNKAQNTICQIIVEQI